MTDGDRAHLDLLTGPVGPCLRFRFRLAGGWNSYGTPTVAVKSSASDFAVHFLGWLAADGGAGYVERFLLCVGCIVLRCGDLVVDGVVVVEQIFFLGLHNG